MPSTIYCRQEHLSNAEPLPYRQHACTPVPSSEEYGGGGNGEQERSESTHPVRRHILLTTSLVARVKESAGLVSVCVCVRVCVWCACVSNMHYF